MTTILSTLVAAAPALADPAGAAMPDIAEDNPLIERAEGAVTIVTMSAPDGFKEAVMRADGANVIDRIFGMEEDGAAEAEVAVFFVANWEQGIALARAVESDELAERYDQNREKGYAVDSFDVQLKGGEFQVFTIASGLAPYEVPAECYARLVVRAIYQANEPGDFRLRACAESFE
ncbi:hypothetical protein P1J78_17245 [Psychromarinibacter sp. C21-152]|uniref:Uncharacterized protein n=1 Tax=Psychromarinibacter sediminicola TaxID=3033385 RepID=A0AAE3NUT3_9RHOB|nr:hypothetical protein [Psychromarinibacter sediminicola]MDF0602486.1 hypothetical protein [Psychromarinibacter sediminicola]